MKKFFVPGNISLIFKICKDPDPRVAGSLGVGFTINKGVEVSIQKSKKIEVYWNNKIIDLPTVTSVIQKLIPPSIAVFIESELPLGCGFGLSGASALGTTYAINDQFNLNKSKLELAKIAHVAEVENGTGLGDVVNEYYTGFLLKTVPSSEFKVRNIPISNIPIYVKYFSKISTKEIITNEDRKAAIDKAGEKTISKINDLRLRIKEDVEQKELFSKILIIAKEFAIKSGLLKDQHVIRTIQKIESDGGRATMIMLGNAVVADIPFKGSTKLLIS